MVTTKWLNVARSLIGTRELPGPANSPKIMGWANALGVRVLGAAYVSDSTPWCGLFAAWCMTQAGIKPPAIAVRAKAWATWGQPVPQPYVGAVAVFSREGGGHVGFIAGHDPTHLHILGGNQGDAVNVSRIARNRCIAMRWPSGVPVIPVTQHIAGGVISTGEA